MWGKAAKYTFLSFCSFSFFTLLFHTVASAQSSVSILSVNTHEVIPTKIPLPTPTIFVYATPTPPSANATNNNSPTSFKQNANPDSNSFQIEPQLTFTPLPLPTNLSKEISIPTPTIFILLTPTPTIIPTITPIPTKSEPTPTIAPATPTPQPTIATTGNTDLETLFGIYGQMFGVDKEQLRKIARCESTFNPNAVNGPYLGMFQFAASSWSSVRNEMGLDTNPDLRTNAEEAIRTAAYMISKGRAGAWPSCK